MPTSRRTLATAIGALALALTTAAAAAAASHRPADSPAAPPATGARFQLEVLPDGRGWLVLDTHTGRLQHWVQGVQTGAGPSYEVTSFGAARGPGGGGYEREIIRPATSR